MSIDESINKVKKTPAIRAQIGMWASFRLPAQDMMTIYNVFCDKWETKYEPKIIALNKSNVIKDLSRNYRFDVLPLILQKNPNYLPAQKEGYGPLNVVVWTDKKDMHPNLQSMKNTINVLLNDYKFRIFTTSFGESITTETILGSIFAENSVVPIEIKQGIYDYITRQLDYSYYSHEFQHYINAVSSLNVEKLRNKFLFMITQFSDKTLFVMMNNLLSININDNVEIHNKIKLVMGIITGLPNTVDTETNRYFYLIDLEVNRQNLIYNIVDNVDKFVMKSNGSDVGKKYCLMFACLGCLFEYDKQLIYNKIKSYREQDWYKTAILYFILYSNVDLNKMKMNVKTHLSHYFTAFFSKYLKTYYLKGNVQSKVLIENVISKKLGVKMISANEINDFIIDDRAKSRLVGETTPLWVGETTSLGVKKGSGLFF